MTNTRRGDFHHPHLAAATAATLSGFAGRDLDGLARLRRFAGLDWSRRHIDRRRWPGADVADLDGVPLVAARVDLVDDDDATIGGHSGNSTVAGRRDVTTGTTAIASGTETISAPDGATETTTTIVIVAGGYRQVATSPGGIADRGASAGVDINVGAVVDIAAVDGNRAGRALAVGATTDVADVDRIATVTTRIDFANDHDAAVRAGIGSPAITGRGNPAGEAMPAQAVPAADRATPTTVAPVLIVIIAGSRGQVTATSR